MAVFNKLTHQLPQYTGTYAYNMTFSPDSQLLAVATSYNTPTAAITVYRRNADNTFTGLPSFDTARPGCNGNRAISFSSDGKYLAVTQDTDAPFMSVYKCNGETFTKLSFSGPTGDSKGQSVQFCPTANHFAFAGYYNSVEVYKVNSNDTFTKITLPATMRATSVTYSDDGNYLFMVGRNSVGNMLILKRNGDTYTQITKPTDVIAGNADDVAYINGLLAISYPLTSPYLALYKKNGDTFTRVALSITTTGAGDLRFTPDGKYLLSSPYRIWQVVNDNLADVASGYSASFTYQDSYCLSPDGKLLVEASTNIYENSDQGAVKKTAIATTSSANDGYVEYQGSIYTGGHIWIDNAMYMGFWRFTGLSIPKGATIISAGLSFSTSDWLDWDASGVLDIRAIEADNPALPTTYTDIWTNHVNSTLSYDWTVGAWAANSTYNTGDIKSLAQGIVNRANWNSGNAMIFAMRGPMKDIGDGKAVLTVIYTEPTQSAPTTPSITIVSASRNTISNETGATTCTVTFKADQTLTEWEARADGAGVGQGLLVGKNEVASAETTVMYNITSSVNDGYFLASSNYLVNNSSNAIVGGSGPYWAFFRFSDIQVPAGATITNAYLTTRYATFSPVVTVAIHASKELNAPIPIDGTVRLRPITTSHSDIQLSVNNGTWQVVNPNVTSVVQEITDQVGWATGNAIMFFYTVPSLPNQYTFSARDTDTSGYSTALTITYTTNSGSGDSVPANTEVTFEINNTELTQGDKNYRINIYGKNEQGEWTPYEP